MNKMKRTVSFFFPERKGNAVETKDGSNALRKEVLGSMLDVVVGEGGHHVVAVVVFGLVADPDALDAGLLGGLFEVLRQKLALLVEVVAGAL